MDDMQICDSIINRKTIIDRNITYKIDLFLISK